MTLSPCTFLGVVVCLVKKKKKKKKEQGAPPIIGKMIKSLIADVCAIFVMSSYSLKWNV